LFLCLIYDTFGGNGALLFVPSQTASDTILTMTIYACPGKCILNDKSCIIFYVTSNVSNTKY